MRVFRREFLFFFPGILSLGLFGWIVRHSVKKPTESMGNATPNDFVLPENAGQMQYRHDDLVISVDRKRKVVCANHAETGELVWESHGEDRWIVPGAAFPMDISATGELWVANVGRKRLEQLNPQTGRFIASWEPKQTFAGCCNPVRFAALADGRFVTMEKGARRACLYQPSGALESVVTDALSDSEHHYYLCRDGETIHLYDTGVRKHWEVK